MCIESTRTGYLVHRGGDGAVNHEAIRGGVAAQIHLDVAAATPEQLAKLEELTVRAEAIYVRQLLALPLFRPLVG